MLNERLTGLDFYATPLSPGPPMAVPYLAIHRDATSRGKGYASFRWNLNAPKLSGIFILNPDANSHNTRWREAGHFIRNFAFDFQSTRFVAAPRTQRQVAALLTIAADPLHPQVSWVRAPGPPPRPTQLLLETDSSETGPCLARPGAILSTTQPSAIQPATAAPRSFAACRQTAAASDGSRLNRSQ